MFMTVDPAGEKAKFLLVGAYALTVHGYPRATMDIDIWILQSPENARAAMRVLQRPFLLIALTRFIHEGSSRGGADGRGCKARDGRLPKA
ncbi:MAG: hypothetical protein JXA73_04180, partial [Acidobacteria bacterium]|nr:hypothetical protein [Acidobacteriota bacterium]